MPRGGPTAPEKTFLTSYNGVIEITIKICIKQIVKNKKASKTCRNRIYIYKKRNGKHLVCFFAPSLKKGPFATPTPTDGASRENEDFSAIWCMRGTANDDRLYHIYSIYSVYRVYAYPKQ